MLILFSECSSAVSLAACSALPIGRTTPEALGSSRTFANPKIVGHLLVIPSRKISATSNASTVCIAQSNTPRGFRTRQAQQVGVKEGSTPVLLNNFAMKSATSPVKGPDQSRFQSVIPASMPQPRPFLRLLLGTLLIVWTLATSSTRAYPLIAEAVAPTPQDRVTNHGGGLRIAEHFYNVGFRASVTAPGDARTFIYFVGGMLVAYSVEWAHRRSSAARTPPPLQVWQKLVFHLIRWLVSLKEMSYRAIV
jgi:hypothetical protein